MSLNPTNDLSNVLNENSKHLFDFPFIKREYSRKLTTCKFAINMSPDYEQIGLNVEDQIKSTVLSSIEQDMNKKICLDIFDTDVFDYVNLNGSVNQSQASRRVLEMLMDNRGIYSNIVCGGSIGMMLCDSAGYTMKPLEVKLNSGIIYPSGSIFGFDIYIDPYMRYDDGRIGLFNNINLGLDNFHVSVINSATMMPRTVIDYDLSYETGDTKQIFVIGDEFEDTLNKFKQLQRDIKINSVLDGSTD